jgi:transposase-like protein
MNVHKNARLTPLRREEMARDVVEGRLSKAHAARTYGVTGKIVRRWGGAFPSRGTRRDGRPFLAAGEPKANPGRCGGYDRGAAESA